MSTRGGTIQKLGTFDAKDPEAVARAVALLEQRVIAYQRDRATRAFGPLEQTTRQTASLNARPWQIVRVDPTGGAIAITLPAVTDPVVAGSWIGVKNVSASTNAITMTAIGSTIDGSPTFTMSSARQFQWFYAGPDEWERGPS